MLDLLNRHGCLALRPLQMGNAQHGPKQISLHIFSLSWPLSVIVDFSFCPLTK